MPISRFSPKQCATRGLFMHRILGFLQYGKVLDPVGVHMHAVRGRVYPCEFQAASIHCGSV